MTLKTFQVPQRSNKLIFYIIFVLSTNLLLYILRSRNYSVPASMLGMNLASATLIIAFSWLSAWVRRLRWVFVLDSLTSLFPFVLVFCLPADTRMHRFGIFLAFFAFAKALLLVWYSLANTETASWTSARVWVFATSLMLYVGITPWVALAAWPTGDEPHYLLLTHSLLMDHDFDMANNYQRGDYGSFYHGDLNHHTVRIGVGRELPRHDIGLSVLLIPGYALAGRLGAMVELDIVAALLALGICELAIGLGASRRGALCSWALFAFTCPLVVYSSQIYPEIIGAAGAVWATIAFARFVQTRQCFLLVLAGSLLAVLPWFSVRFWMIVGPMLSVIVLYVLAQWRKRSELSYLKASAGLILPTLFSLCLFAVFDMWHYNTPMPNAGYVLYVSSGQLRGAETMFTHRPDIGLLGLLFDRSSGLLALAPIYLIALAGMRSLLKTRAWEGAAIIATSGVYVGFMSYSSFWWFGGWSPAGRFVLPAAALWAAVASLVILNRGLRWITVVLSAWTFLVAVQYTALPLMRYPNGISGVFATISSRHLGFDLAAAFPSLKRASFLDGALAGLWMVITLCCVWLIGRPKRGRGFE
jgi:hypothetical protein